MQVLGVDFTESLSPVVSEHSSRILIGLNLYYEDDGWIVELCNAEATFLHPNMEVDIYIGWPEIIVDLGIISEEFPREYFILLGDSMYINADTVLLCLRLLDNYLVN